MKTVLLSIHPRFAEKILSGTKSVELRKVSPRVCAGDQIALYVTSPQKELVALLTIDEIISGHPTALWPKIRREAGLSFEEYENYFAEAHEAVAIRITKVKVLKRPINLVELRDVIPGFTPPQVFRYLSSDEFVAIDARL